MKVQIINGSDITIDPSTITSVTRVRRSFWHRAQGIPYATITFSQKEWVRINLKEYERILPELQKLDWWE